MATKKVISNLLLAFVLVSVGYAVGKEVTLRAVRKATAAGPPATAPADGAAHRPAAGADKVVVYYMHQTFRCVTCNQIEAMTADLVRTDFAAEVAAGRVELRKANFQQDEALARRFDVASSSVVVVKVRGGREAEHRTLDKVWELAGDRDAFAAYVGGAIRAYAATPSAAGSREVRP